MDIEVRAAAVLAGSGEPLLPLSHLHRTLAGETGPELGTPLQLRERLSRRPDLFLVLERPSAALGTESWSAADRARYEDVLRAAGGESSTLVAVIAPAEAAAIRGGSVAREVGATLAELTAAAAELPGIASALADTASAAEGMLLALTRVAAP